MFGVAVELTQVVLIQVVLIQVASVVIAGSINTEARTGRTQPDVAVTTPSLEAGQTLASVAGVVVIVRQTSTSMCTR